MSEPKGNVSLEEIKALLKRYSREQVAFNEPHITERCLWRNITKEEILQCLLSLHALVYAGEQESKSPFERKYDLYFVLSNTRAYRIVAVLREKSLYVITVIKINRRWQGMVSKYEKKHS